MNLTNLTRANGNGHLPDVTLSRELEQAEMILLYCIQVEPQILEEITWLQPNDFIMAKWGYVYDAMRVLHRRGELVSLLTVANELRIVEPNFPSEQLAQLYDPLPGVPINYMDYLSYANIVKEQSRLRQADRLRGDLETAFKNRDTKRIKTANEQLAALLSEQYDGNTKTVTDISTEKNLTDIGNALRLISQFGEDLRYVHTWKQWIVWDGKRWEIDETEQIVRLAKATVASIYQEAGSTPDDDRRQAIGKHALRSEQSARIHAMIDMAQSEQQVSITNESLDSYPWLLNCQNGTLDLQSGELKDSSRYDLLTKIIPAEYHPEAECPAWLSFLARIMENDQERINFLQRAVGYTLTGDTSEQAMFFMYGTGRNGKSTFCETILQLLGDYGAKIATAAFTSQLNNREGATPMLATIAGTRLVVASETEEGRRLNEVLIKDLTGGDSIQARKLFGDPFTFKPQQKIWMYGNHKPPISDTTESIWRRLKTIPFNVQIPVEERDPNLKAKLWAERDGILAWAARGCLEWQSKGLLEPEAISVATASYRSEMDTIGAWLEECCVILPNVSTTAKNLYGSYTAWCEGTGERVETQTRLGRKLNERGFVKQKTRTDVVWQGIGIRSNAVED